MSLKCSDYLKEAVHSDDEQKRLNLLGKACKQISQVLPFKKQWVTLLKQDNLCKYLLLSQCMFGDNIDLIITVMSERLCVYPMYCLEFTKSCYDIFQITKYAPPSEKVKTSDTQEQIAQQPFCNFIYQNLDKIQISCLYRLRDLINFIINQPQQDQYDKCAQQIVSLYKSIVHTQQNQDVIVQTCKDVFYASRQWALVKELYPHINNDLEEILMENQYKSGNVVVDGETENHYRSPLEIPETDRIIESDSSSEKDSQQDPEEQKSNFEQSIKPSFSPPASSRSGPSYRDSQLLKETLLICQVERWLHTGVQSDLYYTDLIGKDMMPKIQKGPSNDIQFSSDFFKVKSSLEIVLAFIFDPLKHKPSPIWQGIQEAFERDERPSSGYGRRKITLIDMPNLKDAITKLQAPAAYYHIRAVRVLQCLTQEQNHINIYKNNSQYLEQTFQYLSLTLSKEHQSYANLNHVCYLLQFYLSRDSEIVFYYFLNSNLQYKFIQCLAYDQVWQFLLQLMSQMTTNASDHQQHQRLKLIDQCWNYFNTCDYFGDMVQYLLNHKNERDINMKCNPVYKTQDMIRNLDEPDFTLDETLTNNMKERLNYITEELYNYKADVDGIKQLISKKYVKSNTIFSKYVEPKRNEKRISRSFSPSKKNASMSQLKEKKNETIMDMIKWAIKEAFNMKFDDDEPLVQDQPPVVETKKLVAYFGSQTSLGSPTEPNRYHKSTSIMQKLPSKKNVIKTPRKLIQMNSLLHQEIDTVKLNLTQVVRNDGSPIKSQSGHMAQSIQSCPAIRMNVIYPMSLKDVNNGVMDQESLGSPYLIENLIKTEASCYNGIQLFSAVINQLLTLLNNQYLQSQYGFDTLNLKFYFQVLFKNGKVNIFDCLMKNYLFKIKITPLKKENSGILSGRLINNLIRHSAAIGNIRLDENISSYVDYLNKVIILSFDWGHSEEAPQLQHVQLCSQIENARLELCETLALLLEYSYKQTGKNPNLLLRISSPTWSTLLSLFTENRTNNIYQNIFQRIFHVAIEYGNINIYHTLFLKLNALNYFRRVVDQAYKNRVFDVNIGLDTYFLVIKSILIQLNQNLQSKTQLKAALLNIEVLENWTYLKQLFKITATRNAPNLIINTSNGSEQTIVSPANSNSQTKKPFNLETLSVLTSSKKRNKSSLIK